MTEEEDRAAAHALADLLMHTPQLRTFKTLWHARSGSEQVRALRVLAARVARVAPDGIHHRQYRSSDPGLDALLCGLVEAMRHRLPERRHIAVEAMAHRFPETHVLPRRLTEIIADARR